MPWHGMRYAVIYFYKLLRHFKPTHQNDHSPTPQELDDAMNMFGDDTISQPEEFMSSFDQFLTKVEEARSENEQQAKREEEEKKKKEAAAAQALARKVSGSEYAQMSFIVPMIFIYGD